MSNIGRVFRSIGLVAPLAGAMLWSLNAAADPSASAAPSAAELRLAGVGINVSDIERSARFYTEVIGLRRAMRAPATGEMRELVLTANGQMGGTILVLAKLDGQPLTPGREGFGRVITNPPDVEAVARRAEAAGFKVTRLPHQPGGPVVAFVEDPDGYRVELYQTAPSPVTPTHP